MSDKNAIHNDKKPINVFISYKRDDNLYNHLVRIVKKTFSLLNWGCGRFLGPHLGVSKLPAVLHRAQPL